MCVCVCVCVCLRGGVGGWVCAPHKLELGDLNEKHLRKSHKCCTWLRITEIQFRKIHPIYPCTKTFSTLKSLFSFCSLSVKKKSRLINWEIGIGMYILLPIKSGFLGSSTGKESACNAGDPGSIHGLGRSPGGGHGNPLQYSYLENPYGQRSLEGYSPRGGKESDTIERLSTAQHKRHLVCISSSF